MEEKLDGFINDQIAALKILYDKNLVGPFLIVVYVTIDIFGYISGLKFDGFFRKYMSEHLPNIKAADLWAARGAFLHENSPNSKLLKKGKARAIACAWGAADLRLVEEVIRRSGKTEQHIGVKVEDIYKSLVLGIGQ